MSADLNGLTADFERRGDKTVASLAGEIDLSNHLAVRGYLNDLIVDGHVHLVLDLTDVTFMDSTGLGALIGTRRRLHAFAGSLAIVLTHEAIRRVFEVTGLDNVFDLHDTLDEALAA